MPFRCYILAALRTVNILGNPPEFAVHFVIGFTGTTFYKGEQSVRTARESTIEHLFTNMSCYPVNVALHLINILEDIAVDTLHHIVGKVWFNILSLYVSFIRPLPDDISIGVPSNSKFESIFLHLLFITLSICIVR